MTFTAQLGTSASMPGNLALAFLAPESVYGGPAPSAATTWDGFTTRIGIGGGSSASSTIGSGGPDTSRSGLEE